MKRFFALIVILSLCVTFISCGTAGKSTKPTIVCTCFPQYDWTMEILGDRAERFEVIYLLEGGVDIHSYQPTYKDILHIKNSDIFICNGGTSEDWMKDVFEDESAVIVDLMATEGITLLENGHDHEHEHNDRCTHTYDEHVWLSLSNASLFCNRITDELCSLDPSGADEYRQNCNEYTDKLKDLLAEYKIAVSEAEYNFILFADRYPFAYLMEEIGVECHAAFEGCSTETSATYKAVKELVSIADERGLEAIAVTEGSDLKLAESIISKTLGDQRIVTFDSMQSVSADSVKKGKSYIATMEQNLEALKNAVN